MVNPTAPFMHSSDFPSRALISRSAFLHNLQLAQKRAGTAEIMAVIKADAYGHGAQQIGQWALDHGVKWLAVAQLGEAIALRQALNQQGRMLALLSTPGAPFAKALQLGIDLSLSAPWALTEICAAVAATGIRAAIHIEVDTGMARSGFSLPQLREIAPVIAQHVRAGQLETVGLWSHFAAADAPDAQLTHLQLQRFQQAQQIVREAGLAIQHFHISASSGLLWYSEANFTMVRPGAILYGISPAPERTTAAAFGFRPVMTLAADLSSVRDVAAGTGVSYGHTAKTPTQMRLATVPLGYADGIPRAASNKAAVLLGGVRCPIIGRVCMDQFVIGTPAVVNAQPGMLATVFGQAAAGILSVDDWAASCETIGYEIVSRIGARVPRYYVA